MTPDGRTHYPGCWREHHDCAIARVEEARALFGDIALLPSGQLRACSGSHVWSRQALDWEWLVDPNQDYDATHETHA